MNRKCPQHPSSSLLTTAAERNKLLTGCYFFACLVFSGHEMNVFVTDLTVDNVVTDVQGFSSGILIIFFVRNCVKCEEIWSNVWLPCMVKVLHYHTCFYTFPLHGNNTHTLNTLHMRSIHTLAPPPHTHVRTHPLGFI